MALSLGTIQATISANVSSFVGGMRAAQQAMANFAASLASTNTATNQVVQAHNRHQQTLFNLSAAAIRFSVILYGLHEAMRLTELAITSSVSEGIKWNSMLEGSAIKWETLTKSVSQAREQLAWMKKFAAETPFEFKELDQASSKIKAFGFSLEQTRALIRVFGDVAAGTNSGTDGINRMTRALGQMRAAGKVMSEEMMQLTELGIPAWEFLTRAMGKTQLELRQMVERGLVPASQAIPIIVKGMDQAFGGIMQRQAQTMEGRWSTLKDTWREILGTVAKPLFDYLSAQLADFLVKSEEIRKALVQSPDGGIRGAMLVAFDGTPLENYVKLIDKITNAVSGMMKAIPQPPGGLTDAVTSVIPGGAQVKGAQKLLGAMNALVGQQDNIIVQAKNGWDRLAVTWHEGVLKVLEANAAGKQKLAES